MGTGSDCLYLVEIRGANCYAARIGRDAEAIHAHTSGRLDWVAATVEPHDLPVDASSAQRERHPRAAYWTSEGRERRRVALFTSKRAAELAIGDGELWNGQQYRIRAARGEKLHEGVVIEAYQAPHRPRRDPAAARVNLVVRVHPDTRERIVSAAKSTGESQGQVIDRLARSLT